MSETKMPDELDRRITELEQQDLSDRGLKGADWLVLLATGVLLPIVVLFWGAS